MRNEQPPIFTCNPYLHGGGGGVWMRKNTDFLNGAPPCPQLGKLGHSARRVTVSHTLSCNKCKVALEGSMPQGLTGLNSLIIWICSPKNYCTHALVGIYSPHDHGEKWRFFYFHVLIIGLKCAYKSLETLNDPRKLFPKRSYGGQDGNLTCFRFFFFDTFLRVTDRNFAFSS